MLAPRSSLSPLLAAIVVAVAASACGASSTSQSAPTLVERSRVSMGSEVHFTAWTSDEAMATAAFDRAFDEFDRLDGLMSVWREGSDVLRLNAAAGMSAVSVSPEVREVLLEARQVSEWTVGKFDVTFGALSGIWKFDHDLDGQIPPRADIAARLPLIDYRALEIDERAGTAWLMRPGMKVHLGGIGKGYAVERSAAILREAGVDDFMIQSGGDLYLAGTRGARPWKVGIQDPRGPSDTIFAAIELTDAAFSTSGDYERFFLRDGHRYHHIMDPDTGEPARGARSVTVVTRSSTLADALSTGVFVLGAEAGISLIERLPDVEGVIVTADNQVLVSSGLKEGVALLRQPTDAP